jgi:nucleoside-diphosphate-sugar epimerase
VSRVLLTGASGFVGAHVLDALVAAGDEVHAVARRRPRRGPERERVSWHEADLLAGAELLGEVRPDVLVHLAWYAAPGKFWSSRENVRWVEASLALLRAFAAAGGRRAVIAGTCAEYEWGGERDLDERCAALAPATLYGVCKDALRRVAVAFAEQAELELAWARLFFLYGPGEDPARLVPAVIRALLGAERIATTTGTQVRDFIHVHDAAGALAALAHGDVTGPVNVASGRGVPVARLLERIGGLTGAGELIDFGARQTSPLEPARLVASVARLQDEVGFHPTIGLEQGLASTVQWWRERGRAPSLAGP